MTDKRFSDRQLDDAIDRAVRDMMTVEPPSDLRARVLAELDGPPARFAVWPRFAFATLALALAIATLVTIQQGRSAHREAPQVATSSPSSVTSPEPAAPPSTSAPTSPDDSTPAPRPDVSAAVTAPGLQRPKTATPSRSHPMQDRVIQAASIDTIEEAAAGSAPVEPVDGTRSLGGVHLKPITQSEIVITPITVERIEITPLSSRR
jgi:hypothetical protein